MITRVMPYRREEMEPALKDGRKVLVTVHGNSLRRLIKCLDHLSDDEVTRLSIPTRFLPLAMNWVMSKKPERPLKVKSEWEGNIHEEDKF